jgi:hypothetical protein
MKTSALLPTLGSLFSIMPVFNMPVFNLPEMPMNLRHAGPPSFGSSRKTVAQDQRRAAKARAVRRAKKRGQA